MLRRILSKIVENEHDSEFMRQKLFGQMIPNYKRLFESLDINKNGVLTKNDLAHMINEYGVFVSMEELGEIISKYTENSSSEVPLEHLIQGMKARLI